MARSYFKLLLSTWEPDSDFPDLTIAAQWLYWVLGSHPLLSAAGVLPIQERRWARRASDATPDTVADALRELVAKGLIVVDPDTEEALIRTFIRHDGGARNPNIGKAIAVAVDRIESATLRHHARRELTAAQAPSSPVTGSDVDRTEGDTERCTEGDTERNLHLPSPSPTPKPSPTPSNATPRSTDEVTRGAAATVADLASRFRA